QDRGGARAARGRHGARAVGAQAGRGARGVRRQASGRRDRGRRGGAAAEREAADEEEGADVVTIGKSTYDGARGGYGDFPVVRPRRLRTTPAMRRMVAEHRLHPAELILPAFVREGITEPVAISSMPGVYQHTRD